jgi:hypothetical protein
MLVLQLPQVVVPPQGSNLQNILESGVVVEDLKQVLVMQCVDSRLLVSICNTSVLVLVSNFENVAGVADVAARVEVHEDVAAVLVRDFHFAFVNEVNL